MTEQTDVKLLFLDTALFDDGVAIRGGALITDADTKPYEFRCTSAVKPTALQKMLYGDTLESYVHVELIGAPLIKAAKEQPSLVIVRNPLLLNVRPLIPFPVVLVSNQRSGSQGAVNLVSIKTHSKFPSEAQAAQDLLTPIMEHRNLLEPFERLSIALIEAHKQRVGDVGGARA